VFDPATGALRSQIEGPNGGADSFGFAIAYGDGDLLVAAPLFSVTGERFPVGQAYLYDVESALLARTIANPEPKGADGFGNGLAIFAGKAAVGAITDDLPDDIRPDGDNPGRVWVFDRDSGNVLFTLENPNPESQFLDWFGWSVAANEDIIVVGAQEDGTSGIDGSGTTYVFDSANGALLHTLFSPQLEGNGEFGRSVAVTPDGNVLVGAWGTSVDGIEHAGHAYLFDGQTGNLLLDIPNPEPQVNAVFGWTVSAYENRIIVGAPRVDADGLPSTGRVYVFASIPEPTTGCLAGTLFVLGVLRRKEQPGPFLHGENTPQFHRLWKIAATLALVFCSQNDSCKAAFTFLGPTPYLSAADSPFPVDGSNQDFFLEDFEDGELNTPGIFQPLHHVFGTGFHGTVMAPSEFTDSVDGDDGIVDGWGQAGHSFRSRALFVSPTIPQLNNVQFEFEFDQEQLGYLPNAFGFVLTDGPAGIDYFRPGLNLRVSFTDSEGNKFLSPFVNPSINIHRNGQTAQDVFLAVINDMPISEVTIGAIYYGDSETMPYLEIDHVQYGRFVIPEPGTCSLMASLIAMLVIWKLVFARRTIGIVV